jgi:hypothetical protein
MFINNFRKCREGLLYASFHSLIVRYILVTIDKKYVHLKYWVKWSKQRGVYLIELLHLKWAIAYNLSRTWILRCSLHHELTLNEMNVVSSPSRFYDLLISSVTLTFMWVLVCISFWMEWGSIFRFLLSSDMINATRKHTLLTNFKLFWCLRVLLN